ncbi:MAG: DUF4286 family protein [Luteibaculaceae bacterium]
MIIYNVTVSIDYTSEQDWTNWMRTKHIPDVLATGCFLEARFCKINGEEQGGASYATTYLVEDKETLERYFSQFAPKLQADTKALFEGKFVAFRTTLDVVEIFNR